ncbi:PCNA-associated factor-like [Vanessa cardui]|uniref:PCNA-associated factor-like n=1 Tax=Vanessa cardui TaxID=171605 RepID=UPI001F136D55|nr:PCNA-associated factor-like [Vanessa cardui]
MARTKASVGAKVSSGKSSKARCSAAPTPSSAASSSNGEKSSRSYSGGNSVCPRETPKWQKPITNFFITNQNNQSQSEGSDAEDSNASASSSKPKPKRNVIESDDEEEQTEKPINKELDETIELEPLTGEDSHKIDEYYATKDKGKGKGKKTANKENLDSNVKRNSVKRDLEDTFDDDSERVTKKIKVN